MYYVERKEQLQRWIEEQLKRAPLPLEAASADASFRRYFRVHCGERTLIAMDAPPAHENCRTFVRDFLPLIANPGRDEIVLCPPYVDLHATLEAVKGSSLAVGAQNLHWENEGAFTGEISRGMLVALGVIAHLRRARCAPPTPPSQSPRSGAERS